MSLDQWKPKTADPESPGTARRNRYFSGKLLTVADYEAEQSYHIERRWLINRMLHGWGLVAGLAVTLEEGAWHVAPGMALDRQGREVVLCADLRLEFSTDLLWLADQRPVAPPDQNSPAPPASYLLSAHYAERWVDGVRVADDYGDGISQANRLAETAVFSLTAETRADVPPPPAAAAPSPAVGRTSRLTRMGTLRVDLETPVPLARVTVTIAKTGAIGFGGVDEAYRPPRLPGADAARTPAEPPAPRTGGPLRNTTRVASSEGIPATPPGARGDKT